MTSKGATTLDITSYGNGLVGRGVLLDIPRLRDVKWLEPGDAVRREELEACEKDIGLTLGEGDILVFRTGHHRRRLELGAWSNDPPPAGEGKAGLHVDTDSPGCTNAGLPPSFQMATAKRYPAWSRE